MFGLEQRHILAQTEGSKLIQEQNARKKEILQDSSKYTQTPQLLLKECDQLPC